MLLKCVYCGKLIDSKFIYCKDCKKAKENEGIALMGVKRIKYICINEDRGWFESKYTFNSEGFDNLKVWIYVDQGYGIIGREIEDKVMAESTFYAKGKHKLLIAAKEALQDIGVELGEKENRVKRVGLHQYAIKSNGSSKEK